MTVTTLAICHFTSEVKHVFMKLPLGPLKLPGPLPEKTHTHCNNEFKCHLSSKPDVPT